MPPYRFQYDEHNLELIKELFNFYINETLPDVNIHVEGKCIGAHKIILAAASPFLKGIFRTRKDTDLHFEDLTYESMKALIDYMYNGTLVIEYEFLTECLQLADSFKVRGISALYSDDVFTEPGPVSTQMQKTISELMSKRHRVLESEEEAKLTEISENLKNGSQALSSLPKLQLKRNANTGKWSKKIISQSKTTIQNIKISRSDTTKNGEKRSGGPMQNVKDNKFRKIETHFPKGNRNTLNLSVKEKREKLVERRRAKNPKTTNFTQSEAKKKKILETCRKNGLKTAVSNVSINRTTAQTPPHDIVPKAELKSAAIESRHSQQRHTKQLEHENIEYEENLYVPMENSNKSESSKNVHTKPQALSVTSSEEYGETNFSQERIDASVLITQASNIFDSAFSISNSKSSNESLQQASQHHILPMPKENGIKSPTSSTKRFKRQTNSKVLVNQHASRFSMSQNTAIDAVSTVLSFYENSCKSIVSSDISKPLQNMHNAQPNPESTAVPHFENSYHGFQFSSNASTISKPLSNCNTQIRHAPQSVVPFSIQPSDFKTSTAIATKDDKSGQRSLFSPVASPNLIISSNEQICAQQISVSESKKELKKQKKTKKTLKNLDLAQQFDILFGQDPQKDEQITSTHITVPSDTASKHLAHNRVSDWHIDESDVFECDSDYEQHKNDPCPQPEELIKKERRVYGCPGCNKAYTLKSNYRRHYLINHKRLDIAVYKCPMCDSRFTRTDNRHQHIRKIHGFPDPVAVLSWDQPFHVCPMCKKGFTQEHELDRHTQMKHMDSYPKYL